MKKSLVALAALAATSVFAQQLPSGANPNPALNGVNIIGGFDAGYAALNYRGNNKYNGVTYNGTYTSQITMVGIFDLGGGLKADWNYESDINPTTQYNTGVNALNGTYSTYTAASGATNQLANPVGAAPTSAAAVATSSAPLAASGAQAASTWGNGQVKVGLAGSFGYVALGAVNNAGLDWNQMSGPFGTAWGSGYGATQAAVGGGLGTNAKVRYDNSVRYLTPQLAPGLIGSVTYRAKNTTASNNMFSTTTGLQGLSGVAEYAAIYRNGPLNLIAVAQSDDYNGTRDVAGNVIAQQKFQNNSVGGNYTVGAATFYAGYQTQKNDVASNYVSSTVTNGALNSKTTRLGVKYQVTPELSVAATTNRMTAVTGLVSKVNGLGADYSLSKMTSLWFRLENANDAAGGFSATRATSTTSYVTSAGTASYSTANDTTRSRTGFGLRVLF